MGEILKGIQEGTAVEVSEGNNVGFPEIVMGVTRAGTSRGILEGIRGKIPN